MLRASCEHEFAVASPTGRADFRDVVHGLQLGLRDLDPADPGAYRVPTGSVLTADGREAEVALPPATVEPGFSVTMAAHAEAEREWLETLLPDLELTGYSTHLSVSTPADGEAIALEYSRTFAPALMLLTDRVDSPGLLIRPRPQRTELGGEYVRGERLRTAILFAVASVISAAAPPRLIARVEPGNERYGWYVDRRAFGPDLYATGRRTLLTREAGGTISAQEQLETAWALVRDRLVGLVGEDEVTIVDRVVAGHEPLPCEEPDASDLPAPVRPAWALAYGDAVQARRRPGFDVACVLASWELHVYVVVTFDRSRRIFACCPGSTFAEFLGRLDGGELDGELKARLRARPNGETLDTREKAASPGLWDDLGPRLHLLTPERAIGGDPQAPR